MSATSTSEEKVDYKMEVALTGKVERYPYVNKEFEIVASVLCVRTKKPILRKEGFQMSISAVYENKNEMGNTERIASSLSEANSLNSSVVSVRPEVKRTSQEGLAKFLVTIRETSMAHANQNFVLILRADGANIKPYVSRPMTVVQYRLRILHALPDLWYKDEGGREKCMEANIILEDGNGERVNRTEHVVKCPFKVRLVYEHEDNVKDEHGGLCQKHRTEVLRIMSTSDTEIDTSGAATVRFRIEDVSKNHRAQRFCLLVEPDTQKVPGNFVISPMISSGVMVRSKRNKRKRLADAARARKSQLRGSEKGKSPFSMARGIGVEKWAAECYSTLMEMQSKIAALAAQYDRLRRCRRTLPDAAGVGGSAMMGSVARSSFLESLDSASSSTDSNHLAERSMSNSLARPSKMQRRTSRGTLIDCNTGTDENAALTTASIITHSLAMPALARAHSLGQIESDTSDGFMDMKNGVEPNLTLNRMSSFDRSISSMLRGFPPAPGESQMQNDIALLSQYGVHFIIAKPQGKKANIDRDLGMPALDKTGLLIGFISEDKRRVDGMKTAFRPLSQFPTFADADRFEIAEQFKELRNTRSPMLKSLSDCDMDLSKLLSASFSHCLNAPG